MGASPVRLAGAGFVLLALTFGLGAFTLGFRAEGVPGPGLLPLVTSALLLPVGLRLLLRPAVVGASEPFRRAPLLALALLAVYAAVLPHAGFVVPSLLFLTVWAMAFHGRPLASAAVMSVALTAASALLFRGLLGVLIPLWPGRP
jgi:hypothetical protein